jgi:hypothetical protein
MGVERGLFRASVIWLFGPIVWAAHFFLLYGFASFACVPSDTTRQEFVRLISLALTAVAIAAIAGFLRPRPLVMRRQQAIATGDVPVFLGVTSKGLAILALIGIVWTAVSAVMIPACTAAASDLARFRTNCPRG